MIGMIENVRVVRIYSPTVQAIMFHDLCAEDCEWWDHKVEDKKAAIAFVRLWNKTFPKSGEDTAADKAQQAAERGENNG